MWRRFEFPSFKSLKNFYFNSGKSDIKSISIYSTNDLKEGCVQGKFSFTLHALAKLEIILTSNISSAIRGLRSEAQLHERLPCFILKMESGPVRPLIRPVLIERHLEGDCPSAILALFRRQG